MGNTLQSLEKRLADLGIELERTRARRLESQAELRHLSALAQGGDNKSIFAQHAVNKRIESDSTLIVSLEYEISEVRRQCDLARGQLAAMAIKAAESSPAVLGERLFEVEAPNGSLVRHRHATADSLQKMLQPGYKVVAEVWGADIDGKGGLAEPIGQSTMKTLLAVHGDELIAFLAERGIVGSDKVIVLPSNGREKMQ
jgi:hypothetical protein